VVQAVDQIPKASFVKKDWPGARPGPVFCHSEFLAVGMGMMLPVMSVVVLVRPVALMYVPSIGVVVVVRVCPVSALVRGVTPLAGHPYPAPAIGYPIAVDPDIARSWNHWTDFITQRRRRGPNCDAKGHLPRRWDCKGRSQNNSKQPFCLHFYAPCYCYLVKM